MTSETLHLDFHGHRLTYRVGGDGPALVVLNLYRRRPDMLQAQVLSTCWRVFQIFPVGYGYSDRAAGYAGELLPDQVLAVLDRHGVDRFVVWGYSAAGAMSLCIARGTGRVVGLVCGGFAPYLMTPGTMRRLDRRLHPDHPSRSLWWWYNSLDWPGEVHAMSCARLFYWGSADRQMAARLRCLRDQLTFQDVDFIEFPGLDHGECSAPESVAGPIIPAVADWVSQQVGPLW